MKKGIASISDIRKKITSTHEMISTSYHEAGHTIYALLRCMRVSYVCIYENKNRIDGVCCYETPELSSIEDIDLLLWMIGSEIGIKYAGLTAEKYFFKTISGSDKFPIFLRDGSSEDTLSAAAIIRNYNVVPPGRKRYEFKKRKINQVLKELKKHWDDVTILSHALFSKKKLSFDDIKKLLLRKSKNKSMWKERFKIISSIFEEGMCVDEKDLKYILIG